MLAQGQETFLSKTVNPGTIKEKSDRFNYIKVQKSLYGKRHHQQGAKTNGRLTENVCNPQNTQRIHILRQGAPTNV